MAAGESDAQEKAGTTELRRRVSLWGAIFKRCWRNVKLGVSRPTKPLLAGVIDTFSGHYQLSDRMVDQRTGGVGKSGK